MLLLAAAQQTGLLEVLVTAVMGLADLTMAGRRPTSAVVDRFLRTLW